MSIYGRLRQRALDKRNKAVAAARAEYQACIDRITFLERRLAAKRPLPIKPAQHKHDQPLGDRICQVMPKDRLFTILELVDVLKNTEPRRMVNAATVRAFMHSFCLQGIVRRVSRGKRCVHWAAADFSTPDSEFGAKSLPIVIEQILGERGRLTPAELVVTIQSRKYRPTEDPRMLLRSVREALRTNRGKFTQGKGQRWTRIQ